ncbi:MAG: hypothetical protein AAF430_11795 [Myxococcota bacterium]
MADRAIALTGRNPVWIGGVFVLGAVAALLWLGPGVTSVDRARDDLAGKEDRFAQWEREREAGTAISDADRESWALRFERVRAFGEDVADDASLMARVAERLRAPSVRGVEVVRTSSAADEEEDEAEEPLRLYSSSGDEGIELRRVPLRVKFVADYQDLKRILDNLTAGANRGVRVRHLDVERSFPDVRVELEIDIWKRSEIAS